MLVGILVTPCLVIGCRSAPLFTFGPILVGFGLSRGRREAGMGAIRGMTSLMESGSSGVELTLLSCGNVYSKVVVEKRKSNILFVLLEMGLTS